MDHMKARYRPPCRWCGHTPGPAAVRCPCRCHVRQAVPPPDIVVVNEPSRRPRVVQRPPAQQNRVVEGVNELNALIQGKRMIKKRHVS